MKTILLFALSIIFLSSCRSLQERNEECIENMPVEVREHVRSFMHEAEIRGKKIALRNLRFKLVSYELKDKGNRVTAQSNTLTRKITIDITSKDWRNAPKAVVFHELGHTILKLEHSDNKNDIMYKYGIVSDNRITVECIDRFF